MPPKLRIRDGGNVVNYRNLNVGAPIPVDPKTSVEWNPKQFFDVKVLETKTEDGRTLQKVHYIGWPSKYDQWVTVESVVTRSSLLQSFPEDMFQFQVFSVIRDNLHCQRGTDSLVSIKVPVCTPAVIKPLTDLSTTIYSHKDISNRSLYRFNDVHAPNVLFGEHWWYRVLNPAGDFCFVNRETLSFGCYERKMREEYDTDFKKTLVHRGFVFYMTFVKEKGNHVEMDQLRHILKHV